MSKPKFDVRTYINTIKHIKTTIGRIVYSRAYNSEYDFNAMLDYLISKQIKTEDLLEDWKKEKSDKIKYTEIGEVSNSIIEDWMQKIIEANDVLLQVTGQPLKLENVKGSLDDVRKTKYKDYDTIQLLNILVINYKGDVTEMIKDAKNSELNTKMEEEESGYDENVIVEKEEKVLEKQEINSGQIELKANGYKTGIKIDLPDNTEEVNININEELEKKGITLKQNGIINIESEDKEYKEINIREMFSKSLTNLEEWMKKRGIINVEPMIYLLRLLIWNDQINDFILLISSIKIKQENTRLKREQRSREKKAQIDKKKSRKRNILTKEIEKETNIIPKKSEPVTEKIENVPIQTTSSIPIKDLSGEESNKSESINTVNEDLKEIEKEKNEFDPKKYDLEESIRMGDIEIRFDGKKPSKDDLDEFEGLKQPEVIERYLGEEKTNFIVNQLNKYKKYLGSGYEGYSEYGVLLVMIREQGQLKTFRLFYNNLLHEEELKEKEESLKIEQERLQVEKANAEQEIEEKNKKIMNDKNALDEMIIQLEKKKDENMKKQEELEKEKEKVEKNKIENERIQVQLNKENKKLEEKKIDMKKQEETITKMNENVNQMKDITDKKYEQITNKEKQFAMEKDLFKQQAINFINQQIVQSNIQQTNPSVVPSVIQPNQSVMSNIPVKEEISTELINQKKSEKKLDMNETIDEQAKKLQTERDIKQYGHKIINYAISTDYIVSRPLELAKARKEKRERILREKRFMNLNELETRKKEEQ